MGKTDDPSLLQSVKSKAKALGLKHQKGGDPVLPTHSPSPTPVVRSDDPSRSASDNTLSEKPSRTGKNDAKQRDREVKRNNVAAAAASSSPHPASSPNNTKAEGAADATIEEKAPMPTRMKNGTIRFVKHTKDALCYSWINLLLVFVPIGIASHLAHLGPEIVFAMNAVAIIPLAGLLSHATEAVAARLGDTLGALLNVSFGNAVELILFIILLAGDQIRVVQAALLGSILANLLLILGMAFLLGGLRFQEQVYNSTVTQMSACMLSLAVMSLLLPTAFHSAFSNYDTADRETLYVSRGTSVVLLLVYILYLLFQLKSHSYMYASTPQHIIDEESHPGVLNDMFNSSSSSDSSSDSSSTDSDSSAGSHTTAKRIKRAFKNRRRRKSSVSSKDTPSAPSVMTSPSVEHHKSYFDNQRNGNVEDESAIHSNPMSRRGSVLNAIMSGDEADTDERAHIPVVRDFEAGSSGSLPTTKKEKRKSKHKKHHRHHRKVSHEDKEESARPSSQHVDSNVRVAFADEVQEAEAAPAPRRPFRPGFPSLLSNNVFNNPQNPPPAPGVALANLRMAGPRGTSLRRTTSLPDRMNRIQTQTSETARPAVSRAASGAPSVVIEEPVEEHVMSRTAAVVMLMISTALVAVCADFMSDAIEPMVEKTNVSAAFIGLIILPIVGNAAEHVTAVTVAAKNKMDLAIGVAVGSSIQIAIFITPFIVILGWIMNKEMSLYFNIFETVALFVTAFVVNFLVLDGRSNYLEGSLLIAAYVIIALSSFFYPDGCDASPIGGQEGTC